MKKFILFMLPLLFLAGCTPEEEAENLERALDTTAESMGYSDFDFEVRDVANPDISIDTPEGTININDETRAALDDFDRNALPELQRRQREYAERVAARPVVVLPTECPLTLALIEDHCTVSHPIQFAEYKRDRSYLCQVLAKWQPPALTEFTSTPGRLFYFGDGSILTLYVEKWTEGFREDKKFILGLERVLIDEPGVGEDAFIRLTASDTASTPRDALRAFSLFVKKGNVAYRFDISPVFDDAGTSMCTLDQTISLARDLLD